MFTVNMLHVANKGFLRFFAVKTTKQLNKIKNTCEYCDILELSSARVWRSEIVTRNLIGTMFLSVSYDYVFEYCCS